MSSTVRSILWSAGIVALLLGLEFGLEPLVTDSSIRQLLMLAAVYVMVATSLNVINGMAGQFSIGHAGFVGIGAYTAAIVASRLHTTGLTTSFAHSFIAVPLSVGMGAVVAALFGL